MNPGDATRSELFDLAVRLQEVLRGLEAMNAQPEHRSRFLSLAITNVEQGDMWLERHLATCPIPSTGKGE